MHRNYKFKNWINIFNVILFTWHVFEAFITSHDNYMKKYNINATYILTVNFGTLPKFKEKALFLDMSEKI